MANNEAGRKGRPLWQWILLGLLLFIISTALLLVGFFRYTQTGREISNLTSGIVEITQLSGNEEGFEAKTPLGQWVMRVRDGLKANSIALERGVADLRASGFMTSPALSDATARTKARKGVDQYITVLRGVRSASLAVEETALSDLAAMPIPASVRDGLRESWAPTFGALMGALEVKLTAEEAFVSQAGDLYTFMEAVDAKAGYQVVEGQIQFHTQADLDAFRQKAGRLDELRERTAEAHDAYMKAVAEFPQAFQEAVQEALR